MAGARDDEGSYSPKHRILGAIIVVSLAVIFLPMILSDGNAPPRRESPVSKVSEAPPPDTKVFRMPAASLEPAPAPPVSSVGASKPEATSPAQQNATVKPAPKVSASARPRTLDPKAPSKVVTTQSREQAVAEGANTDAAGKTEGWILQVGTFSSDENAKRLRDRLQKEGFLVNLQNVELKGRKVVRVRVGPFRQKHVAMEARSKIEKEVGLEGVLLAYP
jgi:DedD protein